MLVQALAALVGGMSLFLALTLLLTIGFNLVYSGRIFPGVSIAGIELSGMSVEEADSILTQRLNYPQGGTIALQYGEKIWTTSPADLGLLIDPQANANLAYSFGRTGNLLTRLFDQLAAWHEGANLAPVMIFDERAAYRHLSEIAAQVDSPTVEASLKVNGTDVEVIPGQVGRTIDIFATLHALQPTLRSLTDGIVTLVIKEEEPAILDASQQAEIARQILSAPLTLLMPDAKEGDPGPWVIPPDQLAGMLTIERLQFQDGWRYQVGLDDQALYDYLSALVPDIDRQPENTRFMFNDDTRLLEVIQPAVIGRNLDVFSTIQEIRQKVIEGQHQFTLQIKTTQPEIGDNKTGAELGITEQIIAYTTYFRGSTKERLQNIQTAAAQFHGLLIPPGAVFSMASVLGSVSLDTGYAEAWIIFGGRTIKGVGGGVCQVSTTLFRAAFFAGYPIIERYPHAYRVSYYEQTARGEDPNLAGLDATVFLPVVDFKFQNDTPYWLLMETYFYPNSRSLTWKFYSTSDGRTVEWNTSGPQNIVEAPDPIYEENPELDQGEIKQVDWAAEGADVMVTRTVYRDGVILFSDSFITHYLPWADVFQYGAGTELPKQKPTNKPRR